jgi:sugar phosphate permease
MISDFFGPEIRGRALSIFYLGMPIGGTFAFIMAGLLLDLGWRNLFYIAGVPGFILTVLIWKMIDPPRGSVERAAAPADDPSLLGSLPSGAGRDGPPNSDPVHSHGHAKVKGAALREYLQLLKTPTLLLVILAQAFAVIILVPLVHDGVEFFVKFRGLGPKEARLALGLIALVAGGLGNGLSGTLGDRLRKRFKGAYALLAGISFLVGFPCLIVGFKAPSPWVFLPALTLGAFCIFLCMPAVNTQIANSTRPTQRAMAWAMAVFILHLLGDTSAPVIFSLVSGHVGRLNAFVIFSTALLPASICCFLAARTAPRDEARIAESANQA